jgi:DNA repair protein RecN (Recombination protein N)
MLSWLQIKNLAIADHIELDISAGLSVITGETGAGKSIIINALGLVLGQRAEAGLVKHGQRRAEIQANFEISDNTALRQLLTELSLDEDDECQLRRVIHAESGSKAYVNGRSVTASVLRQIGEQLLDIHGQHEHQSLLRGETQRELLDKYANISADVHALEDCYLSLRKTCNTLNQLQSDSASAHERLAFLQYQVEELEQFSPQADEWKVLNARHQRIHHQAELVENIQTAEQALFGDANDSNAVSKQLNSAIAELAKAQLIDSQFKQITDILHEAQTLIDESESALAKISDSISLDKDELADTELRYAAYMEFSRKHRVKPDALFATYQSLVSQLEHNQNPEKNEQALRNKIQFLAKKYQTLGRKISQKRRKYAAKLSEDITKSMQLLAMEGGVFEVSMQAVQSNLSSPDNALELPPIGSESGYEKIIFKVSTNAGMPKSALTKVASGGELSRISLAIQLILSDIAAVNTLVFDEVDVGVGGKTAAVIGKMLAKLARSRQILCITHLPQVASYGAQHFYVDKQQGKQVQLTIHALANEDKVAEIARMVGGERQTEESIAHARTLIQNSV